MTVKDLRDKLDKLDPSMIVLVSGYEDGYDLLKASNIKVVEVQDFGPEKESGWWRGRFQTPDTYVNRKKIKVVALCR